MMKSSGDDRSVSRHAPRHRAGAVTTAPAGTEAVVDVEKLVVRKAKREILRGLDLTLHAGSITGLFGPSGCGKTTLMRSIVGVQKPHGGRVTVLGVSPGSREPRSDVGYVTQAAAVYKDLTLLQNVRYFARLYSTGEDQVRETIATVGLTEQADQKVSSMSGGQASRASLACALVARPKLLVLDEPTVGLDPVNREELWGHFRAIAATGTAIMVSSHVMDEAGHCDHLVLMREGTILERTTPGALLAATDSATFDQAFLAVITRGEAA